MNASFKLAAMGAAFALTLLQAPLAMAHGDMSPKHGGRVQMTGETVIELAGTPRGTDVYLTEEDEALPAAAFTAKLIITAAGKRQEIALAAAGGNRLTAAGLRVARGSRVVVALVNKASGARIFATFPAQ
jgi:hypothetical protein